MATKSAVSRSIALLGQRLDENKKTGVPGRLVLDQLVPYKRQARTKFDPVALAELSQSIAKHGVIAPLLVRQMSSGQFEILAGERRWRAARMAGLAEVPVLIRTVDDEAADDLHIVENLQRENLDTLELATRVQEDLKRLGGKVDTVAAKYGKSKGWVSKLAAIASSDSLVSELVEANVTADRAVLATVASMERKDKGAAEALVKSLKDAPASSKLREVATAHSKDRRTRAKVADGKSGKEGKSKASSTGAGAAKEPAWRTAKPVRRPSNRHVVVRVELDKGPFAGEFKELRRKHGEARIAVDHRHASRGCALVEFGSTGEVRRAYRVDELRITLIE